MTDNDFSISRRQCYLVNVSDVVYWWQANRDCIHIFDVSHSNLVKWTCVMPSFTAFDTFTDLVFHVFDILHSVLMFRILIQCASYRDMLVRWVRSSILSTLSHFLYAFVLLHIPAFVPDRTLKFIHPDWTHNIWFSQWISVLHSHCSSNSRIEVFLFLTRQ